MKENKVKTLIVIKPNGNHSNRLLQNLHFEAFCMEYNIHYQNPTLHDLADYYNEPCNTNTNLFLKILQINLLGKLFRHSRIIKKIFSIVWIFSKISRLKFIRFDKENTSTHFESTLLKAFEKHNVIYVGGWRFRVPELTEKFKVRMSQKYALKKAYWQDNTLELKTENLKTEGYTLVGVHIRRGDYKKWKGGMYFFKDEIYKKYMEALTKKMLNEGKEKFVFILFSNEELEFKESNEQLISKENWYIDHRIMSKCNYLIGPPSTFTLWAGYIGQSKNIYIYSSDDDINSKLI